MEETPSLILKSHVLLLINKAKEEARYTACFPLLHRVNNDIMAMKDYELLKREQIDHK